MRILLLAWIAAAPGRLILLCQEEAPGDCHRHKIALQLSGPVAHIYRGEVVMAEELERSEREDSDYAWSPLDELLDGPQV